MILVTGTISIAVMSITVFFNIVEHYIIIKHYLLILQIRTFFNKNVIFTVLQLQLTEILFEIQGVSKVLQQNENGYI